jgi:hypothetical protein
VKSKAKRSLAKPDPLPDNSHEFRSSNEAWVLGSKESSSYQKTFDSKEKARENEASDSPKPFKQPAGYDLNGIGGEKLASPPSILARGFRQERVLMSHDGYDAKGSDYKHNDERGFRYRAKHDGV